MSGEDEQPPDASDVEFLARLRERDEGAWTEAFGILFPMAFRSAWRVSPNWEDAEEVAMKTLSEISTKPELLDKKGKSFDDLKKLTVAIARRRAIDEVRKGMAEKRGEGKVDSLDEEKDDLAGALDLRKDVELAELVGLVIQVAEDDLSEKERNLLFDRFTLGLTLREIAEKRDLPEGSVGVTLGRIIDKIKEGLRQRGLYEEGGDA